MDEKHIYSFTIMLSPGLNVCLLLSKGAHREFIYNYGALILCCLYYVLLGCILKKIIIIRNYLYEVIDMYVL